MRLERPQARRNVEIHLPILYSITIYQRPNPPPNPTQSFGQEPRCRCSRPRSPRSLLCSDLHTRLGNPNLAIHIIQELMETLISPQIESTHTQQKKKPTNYIIESLEQNIKSTIESHKFNNSTKNPKFKNHIWRSKQRHIIHSDLQSKHTYEDQMHQK